MFRYGFLLVFLLALAGAGFVAWHVWRITPGGWVFKLFVTALYVFWMGLAFAGFFFTEKVSLKAARSLYIVGNTWWIVMLYLLMFFLAADLLSLCRILPRGMLDGNAALGGGVALILAVVLLGGRIHYAHKYRETLTIRTEKPLDRPLTIVLASDLHLGYHNSSREFARWVDKINAEKPDLILIGGDIVDRSARPLLEEDYAGEFHRFTAPVISVLGNHEYYSDREASERFFREAEIVLLRDSLVRFRGVTVIGRDDRTNPHRQPLASLVPPADSSFTILLDHQPYHLEEAEAAGVDFQFSGHTHRGQVWPLSWVTDALYEKSWGHHRRGNTQYYVSSGIGLWGPRFRIGTRSEYLILKLLPEDER